MRTRDKLAWERKLKKRWLKFMKEFPFLWAISRGWFFVVDDLPRVQNPTVEFFSQPFPDIETNHVWIYGIHSRAAWIYALSTHFRLKETPRESLGSFIYNRCLNPGDSEDGFDGLECVVLLANRHDGSSGHFAFAGNGGSHFVVVPSRPGCALTDFLKKHFGS